MAPVGALPQEPEAPVPGIAPEQPRRGHRFRPGSRTTKSEDRLNDTPPTRSSCCSVAGIAGSCQQFCEQVLAVVDILVFIHKNMLESMAGFLADLIIVFQQLNHFEN